MNTLYHIITYNDVFKLPRPVLQEISTGLKFPKNKNNDELAKNIWENIAGDVEARKELLNKYEAHLLGGRPTITWYKLGDGDLSWLNDAVEKALGSNPFTTVQETGDIDKPVVEVGAELRKDEDFMLMYKLVSGSTLVPESDGWERVKHITRVPGIYMVHNNILEIRAKFKFAKEIAESLAQLLGKEDALSQVDIMTFFGGSVEKIVETLGGRLIDSKVRPEIFLENLKNEYKDECFKVFQYIDSYLSSKINESELIKELGVTKMKLADMNFDAPFTFLIISGLETLGLGLNKDDLRDNPLYKNIRPFVDPQEAIICILENQTGNNKGYVIKVGKQTKNVVFMTTVTDNVVQYVREKLITFRR